MKIVLGISAFYHDSAACLIIDGRIEAAAQEERFSRKKHDSNFPLNAINFCLSFGKISISQVDYIVFYDKPFLKFERLLETYLAFAPRGFKQFFLSFPVWIKDKLFQKSFIIYLLNEKFCSQVKWSEKLLFSEHHLSHAASAFFPSPFKEAAILTMDGVGEWTTTSLAIGTNNSIKVLKEINFPHSIGLLYSAFTYYLGFKVNSGEYKVMGLAPYGRPIYRSLIKKHLIDIKDDGSFHLDMKYFNYCTDITMTNKRFHKLFGSPPRKPESQLTQREMDIAASIQSVTEEIVIKLCKSIRDITGKKNLCLAGGVALNCVANGKVLKEKIFDNIWIQPASGDAGGAIGAALAVYYQMLNQKRKIDAEDSMKGGFLGPSNSQTEIKTILTKIGAKFKKVNDIELVKFTVDALIEGKAVGWHQGRMEFGPRSLGARSILADPRSPSVQKLLNLKVKFRESFRPFAPSILREDLQDWFQLDKDSPYMMLVADVTKNKQVKMTPNEINLFGIDKLNVARSEIPAVTHVDYSARIQTVHRKTNFLYYKLLSNFKKRTGCPILVNTSFNVRGEPIVCSPEDSFNCFMGTGIEFLVIGNYILRKEEQNKNLIKDYKNSYELD